MSTDTAGVDPFDDPDVALPTEDEDPESLAGDAAEFDPDTADEAPDGAVSPAPGSGQAAGDA
jgi:hypothetical protein